MSNPDYLVLSHSNKTELEKKVNAHIEQSYVPSGNIYCEGGETCSEYHQAMVKKPGFNRERLEELREKKRQRESEKDTGFKDDMERRKQLSEKLAAAWKEKHEGSIKTNNADKKLEDLYQERKVSFETAKHENHVTYWNAYEEKKLDNADRLSVDVIVVAMEGKDRERTILEDEKVLDINYDCARPSPFARTKLKDDGYGWYASIPAEDIMEKTSIYYQNKQGGFTYSSYSPNNGISVAIRELDERDLDVVKAGTKAMFKDKQGIRDSWKKQISTITGKVRDAIKKGRYGDYQKDLDFLNKTANDIINAREEARKAKAKKGGKKKRRQTKRRKSKKNKTRKQ